MVTDLTANIQLRKIKNLKITLYIDFLINSEEAGSENHPLIMFLLALKKLNMLFQEVLFIGDSKSKDISGVNAAGMDTIWITRERRTPKKDRDDYSLSNYYIKKIPEVLDILEMFKKNEK